MTTAIQGIESAQRAIVANTSRRQLRLETLERWVAGTQYEDRKSWWDDSVPLWERAPCIVYPVVQIAIQSNTDLVLGEGRFPKFTSKPAEAEDHEENGLSEDDSKTLDRFISEYHRGCRFRAYARDAFASAQGCGSALGLHGVRRGRPYAELMPAKWSTPELDGFGAVTSVEIRYPYYEHYRSISGAWAVRARVYRRVIDAKRDVTFFPADAAESGMEPDWREDPKQSVDHGLGFCPAVWYPFMRGAVAVNEIDGIPIHANILDEIQAHDIAVSQRHRGALLSEPQIVEIGVVPGYSPTDLGRTPRVPATPRGGKPSPPGTPDLINGMPNPAFNPLVGGYDEQRTQPARMKGPGYPWQYPSPDTKVAVLTYPGDALKAQDDNARDLRTKLQEALCVVFLDPENIKFAATTSGKALEAIKQKQLDRCDQFRDDLQERFLLPSVDMQLRIASRLGAGVRVSGATKTQALLKKFDDGMDEPQSAA